MHVFFDNAVFWKKIADYKQGKLEHYVRTTVLSASFTKYNMAPYGLDHASKEARVYYPSLEELIFMLSGARLGSDHNITEDEAALCQAILDSCLYMGEDVKRLFAMYGDPSQKMLASNVVWGYTQPAHGIAYPGFIGHKDFLMPPLRQRPLSNHFKLSILLMAVGVAALVVAFACLQAATLAASGVAVAAVGVAAALGGFTLFRRERARTIEHDEFVQTQTAGWRPIP